MNDAHDDDNDVNIHYDTINKTVRVRDGDLGNKSLGYWTVESVNETENDESKYFTSVIGERVSFPFWSSRMWYQPYYKHMSLVLLQETLVWEKFRMEIVNNQYTDRQFTPVFSHKKYFDMSSNLINFVHVRKIFSSSLCRMYFHESRATLIVIVTDL